MDPSTRSAILAVAVFFCVILLFMTVSVAFTSGFDILSLAALIIIAMIGGGLIGAIRNPPDD